MVARRRILSDLASLIELVTDALAYLRSCQLADGSIAEEPGQLFFHVWDSVNALRAFGLWRDAARWDDESCVVRLMGFLRSCEAPSGLIHSGHVDIGDRDYCAETSSEYILALERLGLHEDARSRAKWLRDRQLESGGWELVDPRVPRAFQLAPSVTGFVQTALIETRVGSSPFDSVRFLENAQRDAGHFGANRFYYNSHYYVLRPVVGVLNHFNRRRTVVAAREFVRAGQREDGHWPVEPGQFEHRVSEELQTAWALEGLLCAGVPGDDPAVQHGLGWLLAHRREDGSWYGGHYPYPAVPGYPDVRAPLDVYATAQVLAVLHRLCDGRAS